MDKAFNTIDKRTLLEIVLGDFHMENYYQEWIDHKMNTFKMFFNHLDREHQIIYLRITHLI